MVFILAFINAFLFGILFSTIICYPLPDFPPMFYGLLPAYLIFFFIRLLMRLPFRQAYKSKIFPPTNNLFHPKVITYEKLRDIVTDVRISPPTFSVYLENASSDTKKKLCDLEYNTWQEEGPDIKLPSNVPLFVYFSLEYVPSNEIETMLRNTHQLRSSKKFEIVTDVNVKYEETMILMNGNDIIFKILNKKFMTIFYIISMLLSCDLFLDLMYWAHVEFVEIRCIKRASLSNDLRANKGEKDLDVQVNIQHDEIIKDENVDQMLVDLIV